MAQSRWHQDPEVGDLIEHLDHRIELYDSVPEMWASLTASEVSTILKEIDRCRKDFVYAARNYFWISTKKLEDQLFSLWPSQELILQKILEIKARGLPQKILIIKARQLGCSTLIEALICWRTAFFSNINALVVSKDINHAAYALWPIMQFIYDRLPWWLQPVTSMRKAEEGMIFENPRYDDRRHNPGLNSKIYVKGAVNGAGQGIRLSAVHVSELCDYEDDVAKGIVNEDMKNALVEDENTFAILESTAKGANRWAHKLWKTCVRLEREAEWFPMFLPWFFEETHVRPVTVDWTPAKEEFRMRERVTSEWVMCDNPECLQYHIRFVDYQDRAETKCVTCLNGTVYPYVISDEKMAWMEHRRRNAESDDTDLKTLRQEQSTSAEEAFVVSGIQLFNIKNQEFVSACIRPAVAHGDFDTAGQFHGENTNLPKVKGFHGYFYPCFQEQCPVDHSRDDNPLLIWEWPVPNGNYCIGADVAEGLGGQADFSVGAVIRYTTDAMSANYQVATWRSNTIEPIHFAAKLYHLGLFYNTALLAVEVNKFDICIGSLRFNLNYPNLYRWKHIDSVNVLSQKLGWETNIKSRPRLWQTMRAWLNHEMFLVRSSNAYNEMLNFVKEEEDSIYGGGDKEEKDDEWMSLMICLFCSTEGTYNEQLGMAVPKTDLTMENASYHVECLSCRHKWPEMVVHDPTIDGAAMVPELNFEGRVESASGTRCPVCGSRRVSIQRNLGRTIPRTDADLLLREAHWTPDVEFDQVGVFESEYDLL